MAAPTSQCFEAAISTRQKKKLNQLQATQMRYVRVVFPTLYGQICVQHTVNLNWKANLWLSNVSSKCYLVVTVSKIKTCLWNMPNYLKNSKWHQANISIYQTKLGELCACFHHKIVSRAFMIKSCCLATNCQLVTLVCVTSCWCNLWSPSTRLRAVWVAYICAKMCKWKQFHCQTEVLDPLDFFLERYNIFL